VKSEAQTKYYQMGYGSGKRDAEIERKARDAQLLREVENVESNLLVGNNSGALLLLRSLKRLLV
jgi:hypothetical protein